MAASGPEVLTAPERPPHRGVASRQLLLAVACLTAGIVPFARWLPGDFVPVAYTALALAFALFARTRAALRKYWELAFAFAIFGLVSILDRFVTGYVGPSVLHDLPNDGNPLASTMSGTVVIQLLDSLAAIVPIVLFTRLSGRDLGSIYLRRGVASRWLIATAAFFVIFYLFLASLPARPDSPARRLLPESGTLTFSGFLALTPALLVVSIANGFEEELLFRGLFLQKYDVFFGPRLANVVQAIVFASAHVGVSYTPNFLLFATLLILPLGLFGGYLMRTTNSIVSPGIFHSALDMAIYLGFLSFAA